MDCVVLDAMGVIYPVGDDVTGLLYPFIVGRGGTSDLDRIKDIYVDTSLGKLASAEFWKAVGIDPALEDEYLRRHSLSRGLITFLRLARKRGIELWCLSNDVSAWSRKLRQMHGLDRYISGYLVSGDVGLRKPDPAIFRLLVSRLKRNPSGIVFVDDQIRNLDAASGLGIVTVLFDPLYAGNIINNHKTVKNFAELGRLI